MAAFGYYTNATQYAMDSHELGENYFILLHEALTPLRFYLSCRVCNRILQNPFTPDHTACQHTVCHACIGGKMRLKPSCGWCKNYENFVDNKSLAVLVQCYKKLCEYIVNSTDYRNQLEFSMKSGNSSIETTKEKIASLLKEGSEADVVSLKTERNIIKPTSDTKSSNDVATQPSSKPDTQSQSSSSLKGDLKLKLIIPSGKRRHWYATAPGHPSKVAKKKLNLTRKTYQTNTQTSELDLLSPSKSSQRGAEEQADSRNEAIIDSFQSRGDTPAGSKSERKLCGCGNNVTSLPGKLTCYGQRCPCYSSRIPCLGCRCRGCRNPNKIVRIEQASEDTDGDEINVE